VLVVHFPHILRNPTSWAAHVNEPCALFKENNCFGKDPRLAVFQVAHLLRTHTSSQAHGARGVVAPSRSLSSRRQCGWKRALCNQKYLGAIKNI